MVPDKRRTVTRTLLRWYATNGRTLPWRRTRDPYRILVSEIMLQQTQVNRVRLKYPEFLKRFPTLHALARKPQREVVIAWSGLGYNRRAVQLHRLARIVVDTRRGKIPHDLDDLLALPGIGKYTANAIRSSAFRLDAATVDVNVRRVLSRLFWKLPSASDMPSVREVWTLAEKLLPRGKGHSWNQALMDLGASVCTARAPRCQSCPVASICSSRPTVTAWSRTVRKRLRKTVRDPATSDRDRIPNRLYRGKIIEELRKMRGKKSLSAETLAKRIYRRYADRDAAWVHGLLEGLRQDGLVTLRGNGSLTTTRVSLA